MATLGFIGLGLMGRHMAGHLINAGHTVHVHDLDAGAVQALTGAGKNNVEVATKVGAAIAERAKKAGVTEALHHSAVGDHDEVRATVDAFIDATDADELMIHTLAYDPRVAQRSFEILAAACGADSAA